MDTGSPIKSGNYGSVPVRSGNPQAQKKGVTDAEKRWG